VTFSAAYRLLGNPEYREMADRAYAYILDKFWDKQYGGVYWTVDYLAIRSRSASRFTPRRSRSTGWRNTTGQRGGREPGAGAGAFRLTGEEPGEGLGRYLEACSRDWGALDDLRLSEKDLNSPKS